MAVTLHTKLVQIFSDPNFSKCKVRIYAEEVDRTDLQLRNRPYSNKPAIEQVMTSDEIVANVEGIVEEIESTNPTVQLSIIVDNEKIWDNHSGVLSGTELRINIKRLAAR